MASLSLIWAAMVLLPAGCSRASMMKKATSPLDESIARRYVDLLRSKQFDQIEADLDPSLPSSDARPNLVRMAGLFPPGAEISSKVVGTNVFHAGDPYQANVTLEYEFPGRWVLATVAINESDGTVTVVGLNVTLMAESVEHLNRFTFVGKGAPQYAILIVAVAAVGLSAYVFIIWLRTAVGKKKWLCVVAILLTTTG